MDSRTCTRMLVLAGFLYFGMGWAQPPRTQFRTTQLMSGLRDPMQTAFLPDGTIYVLLKSGTIQHYNPTTGTTTTAASLTVANVVEAGLQSIALDPNFAVNRRVYVLYGTTTPGESNVVARYTAQASGALDLASRVILLTIPYTINQTNPQSAEHTTGCLAFDAQGNLYISLADNTNNIFSGTGSGYAPRDPLRPNFDAQRSAANTNDLRGKILRIHPEDNGSYTIPSGNLFPAGTSQTRPEIYTMGHRHPFRISIDSRTNWLYFAEPGPNAPADNAAAGPRGYDVIGQAKSAGNYGWPYCRANLLCYTSNYNYTTGTGGTPYNPIALQNNSTNNTGLVNLPPARPHLIWYPYSAIGTAFPVFGNNGANTAMLGPVYYFDGAMVNPNKFPIYYDQHLFIFDHNRSHVHAVQLDNNGAVVAVQRFWDQTTANIIRNPIDLKVGPDGAFYFLCSGNASYPSNGGVGTLVRLDYTGPQTPLFPGRLPARVAEFRLFLRGADGTVRLPSGAVSAEFFDLRGSRVWAWNRGASSSESALLPPGISGVLRAKIRFE